MTLAEMNDEFGAARTNKKRVFREDGSDHSVGSHHSTCTAVLL